MSYEDLQGVLRLDDKRLRQFRTLTEVSRALTAELSREGVLTLAVTRAADLLRAARSVLFCWDDEGCWSLQAHHGFDAETLDAHAALSASSLELQLEALLGDRAEDFLAVPLVVSSQVIGILGVLPQDSQDSPDEQEWFLSAIADQVSVALEKSRLDQAAMFRERLLGIVGHDLRNPLQTIQMNAQVLSVRYAEEEAVAALADRIMRGSSQMSSMIAQLMDFTRSRLGGGIQLQLNEMDLCEAARNAVSDLSAAHPAVEFRLEAEGVLSGRWDRQRIDQVIYNLLGNAVRHGDNDETIRISVAGENGLGVVKVHNFGAPIPEQEQQQLFDPFRRANDARRRNVEGLGLGLYIASEIVHAHGGSISVRSFPEDGTEFSVRLPLELECQQTLFRPD